MDNFGLLSIIPVVVYTNAETQRIQILKENKSKSGVYRWVNLENGKSYVGSSTDLGRRLRNYFYISFLKTEIKKNKSMIYNALLKYGFSKFSLEIIEYCAPENCIEREQYYLDLLKPEYNTLKIAGSSPTATVSNIRKKRLLYYQLHWKEKIIQCSVKSIQ